MWRRPHAAPRRKLTRQQGGAQSREPNTEAKTDFLAAPLLEAFFTATVPVFKAGAAFCLAGAAFCRAEAQGRARRVGNEPTGQGAVTNCASCGCILPAGSAEAKTERPAVVSSDCPWAIHDRRAHASHQSMRPVGPAAPPRPGWPATARRSQHTLAGAAALAPLVLLTP